MAWSENKVAGNFNTPTREFVCDTETDLDSLPKNAPLGSTAFCIKEASVHMIDSEGVWHKL